MRDIRVLYLIDSLRAGGAERVLYNTVEYFRESGLPVRPEIALLYDGGYLSEELRLSGIPVHELGLRKKYALAGFTKLRKLLEEREYDLIHVHLFPASWYAAFLPVPRKRWKWVYTEHSVHNRRREFPLLRPVEAFVYRKFDRIVAVSRNVREGLLAWIPGLEGKTSVIPNGVKLPEKTVSRAEARKRLGLDVDGFLLLYAGRLEPMKGLDVLIRALAGMKVGQFLCLIAGDGPLKERLKALAAELGLEPTVRFLGFRRDVELLMDAADLLVMPSLWEGLPMVLLEAMARFRPAIATRVGGVPELIEDGISGWLVEPGDPDALRERILNALAHQEELDEMGRKARMKIAADYSISSTAQRLLDLYGELLLRKESRTEAEKR